MKRVLLGLTLIWTTCAVVASGCTQAEPPRSFVQPNALRKADFNGTWYYNATVTDAPPTNGNMYVGQYGELQKINWVISESTLFAVRAYAFVNNQEDPQVGELGNVDNQKQYEGEVLAAWTIQSQFDIIRDYNPTTGEETNKIIESTERPWDQREYFRVDWSKNIAPDYTGIGLDFTFGGIQLTDLSYYVSDPTSPDAMHVERADSTDSDLGFAVGEMNYFDITAQVIAQPSEQQFVVDDQGDTQLLPSCFAFYGTEDCASQKIKLRHNFAKLAPADTYEAKQWDGVDQQNFGFFTTELRHNWNRQYGDLYTGDKRWIERFNLWKGSCTGARTCEAPHRVRDPNDGTWLLNLSDSDLMNWERNPGEDGALTAGADAGGLQPSLLPDAGYQPQGVYISESTALAAQISDPNAPAASPCKLLSAIPYNGAPLRSTTDDCSPVAVPDDAFLILGTNGVPASQDTLWVPIHKRTQRTIPYYPNDEMPDSTWPVAKEVIDQWNQTFKVAVLDAYHNDPDASAQAKTMADIQDVFVWCHNPVQSSDPAACMTHVKPQVNPDGTTALGSDGKPIYYVRQGDPRRSSILWVNEYQAGGPLGLGPAMADPETGETISSKANIYGGDLDTYAAWARDLIFLQNGTIDPNSYINGVQADSWVKKYASGKTAINPAYRPEDTAAHYAAMDFSWASGQPLVNTNTKHDPLSNYQAQTQLMGSGLHSGLFGTGSGDTQQAMLNRLRGTPLETQLMVPELSSAMGLPPNVGFDTLPANQQALYSALNSEGIKNIRDQNMMMLEAWGYDFEPFNYNVFGGEVKRYQGVTDPQAIWQDLRQRIFLAVTLHEVGHNMGLRHNFRGSYDAMNYFPAYWQLRQAAANADHPGITSNNGAAKLFPRSFAWPDGGAPGGYNPDIEVAGGELENQYSSIMDYGAAWDTDLNGLGHYDKAAIKYGYANTVEVFTNANGNLSPLAAGSADNDHVQMDKLGNLQAFKDAYGFPSAIVGNPPSGAKAINYWTYPDLFTDAVGVSPDGGTTNPFEERTDVSLYAIDTRNFQSPDWAGINRGANYSSSVQGTLGSNNAVSPLVPYYFCSDEFVGNLTCERFDFGADPWEQNNDIIQRYTNWYLVRNFKRDSYSFHTGPRYTDYTYNRYFEMMRTGMTWLTLLGGDFNDQAAQLGPTFGASANNVTQFLTDPIDGWGAFTDSVNDSFQLFGRVLTAPQAGSFVANLAPDLKSNTLVQIGDTLQPGLAQQLNAQTGDGSGAVLDITQGRFLTTTWNFSGCGYYWGDECQSRIGYFADKWLVLKVLSENAAYFTGFDTAVDVRKFSIGYWLPYKSQISNIFSALLSGETSELGYQYNGFGNDPVPQDIIFRTPAPPQTTALPTVFDPELGFSLQMWSGVFGMSGFTSGFDHSFINNSQVFVVGNGEAPVPDTSLVALDGTPGALATNDSTQLTRVCTFTNSQQQNDCITHHKEWYVFKDPLSGKTYAAHSSPPSKISGAPGGTNFARQDVAVRMLEHANLLATNLAQSPSNTAFQTTYLKYQENLDMMRSLVGAFGYGPYAIQQ